MRVPKLTEDQIAQHLPKLPGWTRQADVLHKTYTFKDFGHAMDFVNQVGQAAESVNHHPDIDIRYAKVTLSLVTASVDPKTHIAQVYLNGTASYQANNGVPYGVVMSNPSYPGYSWVQQTNGPTTASASAYVQCGVKQDNRSVTVSADVDPTNQRTPKYNTDATPSLDVYGNAMYVQTSHASTPDGTMTGDIGLDDTDGPFFNKTNVIYHANRVGSWNVVGSSDHWHHGLLDT